MLLTPAINTANWGKVQSRRVGTATPRARPFVKWVGGKGAILHAIKAHLPTTIRHYYELFVGGGALFFDIADNVHHATIADVNEELMAAYMAIQRNVAQLIELLRQHQRNHCKDYYYGIRKMHQLPDTISRAARCIYLNKTCYNGLYRVNRKGQFNTPMGSYPNPVICDEVNLKRVHQVLQGVDIQTGSFDRLEIEPGSVIYCDPPYHNNYNQYTPTQFADEEQERLAMYTAKWIRNNCTVIISNNDTKLIRRLYHHHCTIHQIPAPRFISCKSKGRGLTTELLMVSK